jgi:hypothetical protein
VQFTFNQFHAALDGANRAVVIVPRGGHTMPMKFAAVAFQRNKFNFGAAEIDTDSRSIRGSA